MENCANFLAELRKSGLGYSSINTARSALSASVSLVGGGNVGSHPLVVRMMRGVFKEAPTKPRYVDTWDPSAVLRLISGMKVDQLSFQDLTQRLAMLVLLCSGQRCQTLAQLAAEGVVVTEDRCVFSIKGLLKTTRPGHVQDRLTLQAFNKDRDVCVVSYVQDYIKRKGELGKL